MGRERWVSVGIFFSRLSFPQAWVSVLAVSDRGCIIAGSGEGSVHKACDQGGLWRCLPLTPTPTVQVKIVPKGKYPRDQAQTGGSRV